MRQRSEGSGKNVAASKPCDTGGRRYSRRWPQAKGWPPARRAAQSARCRAARPWRFATGPRTAAGKAAAARNAVRHGLHSRSLRHWLIAQRRFQRALHACLTGAPAIYTSPQKRLAILRRTLYMTVLSRQLAKASTVAFRTEGATAGGF